MALEQQIAMYEDLEEVTENRIEDELKTSRYAEACLEFLEGVTDVRFIPIIRDLHDIINETAIKLEMSKANLKDYKEQLTKLLLMKTRTETRTGTRTETWDETRTSTRN